MKNNVGHIVLREDLPQDLRTNMKERCDSLEQKWSEIIIALSE